MKLMKGIPHFQMISLQLRAERKDSWTTQDVKNYETSITDFFEKCNKLPDIFLNQCQTLGISHLQPSKFWLYLQPTSNLRSFELECLCCRIWLLASRSWRSYRPRRHSCRLFTCNKCRSIRFASLLEILLDSKLTGIIYSFNDVFMKMPLLANGYNDFKNQLFQLSLALVACICPFMACGTGLGGLFFIGVRFGSVLAVTPFLVLSIGVDDAYLMIHAWQRVTQKRRRNPVKDDSATERLAEVCSCFFLKIHHQIIFRY